MQDDCFPGIVNDDMARILSVERQLEEAAVWYFAIVHDCVVRARLNFLHGSKEQCRKGQYADAARLRAAANARKRRVDRETTGFRHSASDEGEGSAGDIEQGRRRSPVTDELFQLHAGAVGQAKGSAVDKANADSAISCGLDDVTLKDRITKLDLNSDAVGSRKGARAR